ncbi:acyltransferase family protein [Microbacterium aurum]
MTLAPPRPAVAVAAPAARPVRAASFRPDIEGLRAVAVVAVILDHLFAWPAGGFIGVDVFFVISGFLITGLLIREFDRSGRISFADFYRRRARRILPVSALVVIATVAGAGLAFPVARWGDTLVDALWSFFFMANWHFGFIGTDYLLGSGQISPLRHYWSLSVEEQFYLVWPWVIILAFLLARKIAPQRDTTPARRRTPTLVLAAGAVAVIVASLAWALYETSTTPTMAYFSTFSRGWELGIGALLAIIAPLLPSMPQALRTALSWLGIGGIALSLFIITPESPFPAPGALLPVLATAVVVLAGTGARGEKAPSNVILTNPVSAYLGKTSYSLYLWHFPVIIILGAVLPVSPMYFALCLALTVLLSVFSFHFVENPVRHSNWFERARVERWGDRRPPLHAFRVAPTLIGWTAAVALTTAFRIVISLLPKTHQPAALSLPDPAAEAAAADLTAAQQRTALIDASLALSEWPFTDPAIESLSENSAVDEWIVDGCLRIEQSMKDSCVYGDPAALRAALKPLGYSIRSLTMFSCPAMDVSVSGNTAEICDRHHSWVYDEVRASRPDLVIMTSLAGSIVKLRSDAEGTAALAEWNTATTATVSGISDSVGNVVVIAPPPARESVLDCKTIVSTPSDCISEPSKTYQAFVESEKSAVEALGGNAHYVETVPWFCSRGQCPAIIDGVPVSYDGTHLVKQAVIQLDDVMAETLTGILDPVTAQAGEDG